MDQAQSEQLKNRLYVIIFRDSTPAGRRFNIVLLSAIILSVVVVLLDSEPLVHQRYGRWLYALEWVFTILFTIEYALRIYCLEKKEKYIFSAMGIIDLIAILPTYLSLLVFGYQYLLVVRSLRLLRVFRLFKLRQYLAESRFILHALYQSYRKIALFLMFLVIVVIIMGALMYLVEDGSHGFTSIPDSIYWAVVTITTVGYGDIAPVTSLGKFLSVLIMLSGYSIIAVPTGIITSEMARARRGNPGLKCPRCGAGGHPPDTRYCRICAEPMPSNIKPVS
jgi:voltage-gated potassium channel